MVDFNVILRQLYSQEIVSPNYILFCTSQSNSVRSLIHHRSDALDGQVLAKAVFFAENEALRRRRRSWSR